jgi:hypothetical protein
MCTIIDKVGGEDAEVELRVIPKEEITCQTDAFQIWSQYDANPGPPVDASSLAVRGT